MSARRDYAADAAEREAQRRRSPRLIALHDEVMAATWQNVTPSRRLTLENLALELYRRVEEGQEITEEQARTVRADYCLAPIQ